jgi:hypothetical protein
MGRGEAGRPISRLCRLLLTAMLRPRLAATCDAFDAFGVVGASELPLFSRLERAEVLLSSVDSGLS